MPDESTAGQAVMDPRWIVAVVDRVGDQTRRLWFRRLVGSSEHRKFRAVRANNSVVVLRPVWGHTRWHAIEYSQLARWLVFSACVLVGLGFCVFLLSLFIGRVDVGALSSIAVLCGLICFWAALARANKERAIVGQ